MKIVLIGAGSRSFGRGQLVDILNLRELRGQNATLTLVDEDPAALDKMTRLAKLIKNHVGADAAIEQTTDRREALPGADFVVCAVARKRMELWEQDFRVPLAYGFRHCLGENGGPGAIFHALRSFELLIPICKDIERLCPDAWFLNFTNPEARVLHAILHLTRAKAVGLCHGVFGAIQAAARYSGRPAANLHVVSAGMNHLYCLLKVEDRTTGENLLPRLIEQAAEDEKAPPLFRRFAQVFGVFTFPSDDHIGEYLSYGSEFHGVKWTYGQECRPVHRAEPPQTWPTVEDYVSGRRPLDESFTRPSGELAVQIIAGVGLGKRQRLDAINVLNSDGYIENLPRGAAIEIPATVDKQGVHPEHVGALPEAFAAILRTQMTIIELVTEAYRTRSKKLLLRALFLDPAVNSTENARRMLDEMLSLQKEFLPAFE